MLRYAEQTSARHLAPAYSQPFSSAIPIVLCNAGFYGTLAAVRALGSRSVPVVTVDTTNLCPGRWSRFSGQYLRSPSFEDTSAWVEWLLNLGRSGPRRAIYATSDAVSFALAQHREQISEYYDLYQPSLESTLAILDKARLIEHAQAVGLETPETWLPQSRRDAERIAHDLKGEILVKPRSQLSVCSVSKGALANRGPESILDQFDQLVRFGSQDVEFARLYPECMMPMLQRYYPEALDGIYSLSGFRDVTGGHVAMLGSYKVLQRPRRLGIGLCFEDAAVDPVLKERALKLCERIGYFGAFEMEFIRCGGRDLLIDFNGRYYNQMVFDLARGLDIASLTYAGAIGDTGRVADLVHASNSAGSHGVAFCNSFGLGFTIGAQRVLGSMSREEADQWRAWKKTPGRHVVDAVRDPEDPVPATVDATLQILGCLRHPRAFFRQYGSDAIRTS